MPKTVAVGQTASFRRTFGKIFASSGYFTAIGRMTAHDRATS